MDIKISPKNLSGEIAAVSSKSQAHRVLTAAALSGAINHAVITDKSDDIEAAKECLLRLSEDRPVFDCRESGSALRFLLPLSMALKTEAVFTGSGSLSNRPISPLKEQMQEHGCVFSVAGNEICTVKGSLTGGIYSLPGNISSQFITGLLFALPLLSENSEILLTSPLQSASYVTMTLQTLEMFGVNVEVQYDGSGAEEAYTAFRIKGDQRYVSPGNVVIEGDWSNAAFWLAAGALSRDRKSSVTCSGLNLLSSQGDRKITSIIKDFGGNISKAGESVTSSSGTLRGIEVDAAHIPDLIPIISVIASVSSGITAVVNAERLRIKESDRLRGICAGLTNLGADITELPAGLVIKGKERLTGGIVSGAGDHRIIMALSIAATCCDEPVIIEGAEGVSKSYPDFFKDFRKLGGEAVVV